MRTRAGNWFLLVGLSGWACTPAQPQRPPTPAVRDAGVSAEDVRVVVVLPTPTAATTLPPDAGPVTPDAAALPTNTGNGCTPHGPENTAAACTDRIDNDCDGQIDCADNDCLRVAAAAGCDRDASARITPTANCIWHGPENTTAACTDHVDNDCDGQIDCADNDCLRVAAAAGCDQDASARITPTANCVRRGPENTAAACADRIDNDCDGQIDCTDNECAPPAVTVCPPRPAPRPTVAAPRPAPRPTVAAPPAPR